MGSSQGSAGESVAGSPAQLVVRSADSSAADGNQGTRRRFLRRYSPLRRITGTSFATLLDVQDANPTNGPILHAACVTEPSWVRCRFLARYLSREDGALWREAARNEDHDIGGRCSDRSPNSSRIRDRRMLSLNLPELEFFPTQRERRRAHRRAARFAFVHWTFATYAIAVTIALVNVRLAMQALGLMPPFGRWWFPGLLAAVFFGPVPLYIFRERMRRYLRKDLIDRGFSVCAECGYDLRLIPERRCPECGCPIATSDGAPSTLLQKQL